jgi:hypothetical protein
MSATARRSLIPRGHCSFLRRLVALCSLRVNCAGSMRKSRPGRLLPERFIMTVIGRG